MHLTGDGVTRNFLTILEGDLKRSLRSVLQILGVTALFGLIAWLSFLNAPSYAFAVLAAALVLGFGVSAVLTRYYFFESYEVSLRDHWNRWMRWSVSCKTVRECYAKVHDQRIGWGWWAAAALTTGLLITHLVFWALALNEESNPLNLLPLYTVDTVFLGGFLARRIMERRWYRKFLASCNDLLRDGNLGLWGVY